VIDRRARAAGSLLALACGDALGRPLVGLSSAAVVREYGRVTEVRGGPDGRPAGSVTAHAGGALALARTLADGATPEAVGEGAASPVRPVPLALAAPVDASSSRGTGTDAALADAVVAARRAAGVTAPTAVESSVAYARVLASLLDGVEPAAALEDALALAARRDAPGDVRTTLTSAGDPALATPTAGGDAVATLETALHDGLGAGSVEEAVVPAANRGRNAAVAGALAGALAGARFGADAVPARWLEALRPAGVRALAARVDRVGLAAVTDRRPEESDG
jgi:ADP-ribosyl-[dinitrogen reductase] hydrolase